MKELIRKEWRESVKWVPLPGLVVLLVFLIDRPDEPMPDLTEAFLFALTAATFGAALGFLQVFSDAHADRRSLLLHRPIARSRIFLAKALAGVTLYLLALGVPFLGLEAWRAMPGKIPAPFDWRTSLPWLADVLAGLVYYFAGMLVAQRDVRWYASRCLPLGAAFASSYLGWALPEFWQAALAVALIGSTVAVAAWGSFSVGGEYSPQPGPAKAASAVTFLAGLLILSVLGKERIGEWLDPGLDNEYTIDRQGRVFFSRFKPGVGVIGPLSDLSGREVFDRKGGPTETAPLVWTETPTFRGYRNSARFYVKCQNDSKPGNERWYYDQTSGRLCGYDGYYHHLLGSFGPDGFAPAGASAGDRFRGDFRYRNNPLRAVPANFLVFPDRAYRVDFARRTIRILFTPPAGETVLFVSRWSDPLDNARKGLIVSTDRRLHFLKEDGTPVVSAPRLHDPQTYRTVFAGPIENPDRFAVWYQSMMPWTTSAEPEDYRTLPGFLHEYDAAGREVGRQTIPPPPYAAASNAGGLFGMATPVVEAAALVGTCRWLRAQERARGSSEKSVLLSYLEDIKYYIPGTAAERPTPGPLLAVYSALMLLSASASALVCFMLACRYAFSRARRIGWGLVGLCFGWVGLALMLALQDWPAHTGCPRCAKPRVVTRECCEHCGAAHRDPAPDGTEVLEPFAAPS